MLKALIWKETRSFFYEKLRLAVLLVFVLFFGPYFGARFHQILLIPTAMLTMYAGVYLLCNVSYEREVENKTLPNLLASPLTVRGLLLAKGLTIFAFSYATELVGITVSIGFSWFHLGELPSFATVFTALIVVPIWGFGVIELLGIAYNLVRGGMVIWLLAFPLFAALTSTIASTRISVIFSSLWLPPVAGLGMVALLYWLMGKLSKDRMTRLAS